MGVPDETPARRFFEPTNEEGRETSRRPIGRRNVGAELEPFEGAARSVRAAAVSRGFELDELEVDAHVAARALRRVEVYVEMTRRLSKPSPRRGVFGWKLEADVARRELVARAPNGRFRGAARGRRGSRPGFGAFGAFLLTVAGEENEQREREKPA